MTKFPYLVNRVIVFKYIKMSGYRLHRKLYEAERDRIIELRDVRFLLEKSLIELNQRKIWFQVG